MSKKFLLLFITLVAVHLSNAQDSLPRIAADRPRAGHSTDMVRYRDWQIESGGVYQELENNGIKRDAFTINTTVLRYGLLDDLEIEAGWGFQQIKRRQGSQNIQSGFSPVTLGVKVGVSEQMG